MRDRGNTEGWSRRRRPPPRATVDIADRVAIRADRDEIYPRLVDVQFVAGCLPGLVPGSLADAGGGAYDAAVRQTVVGVTATWQLSVTLTPDDTRHHVAIALTGAERRLHMTMNGGAEVTVSEAGPGTAWLDYTGHVEVEGRLAAAGGPIIRKLVGDVLERFVAALGGR